MVELTLPHTYIITSEPAGKLQAFLDEQEIKLKARVPLLQFRAKSLSQDRYKTYAAALIEMAQTHGTKIMLNSEPMLAMTLGADGVHLTESRLMAVQARPEKEGFMVAASCHNAQSLARAEWLALDFAVLSPVKFTLSHPEATPLGWGQFSNLIQGLNLPVFALGGMTMADLEPALAHGAQGIAGIRF